MPPRCPKKPPNGLQVASKKPPRGARQAQTAPTTPKDAPQTTQKTTQRSSKIIFGGAAVLPALRARSAAPPASQDDGGVCGVPDPALAFLEPTPLLILPPPAIAITARPSVLLWLLPSLLALKSAVSPRRNAQIRKRKFPRCPREASKMNFAVQKSSVSPRRNTHF